MLQESPHLVGLPAEPGAVDPARTLERLEQARVREREARTAYERQVHACEQRYLTAKRRFQDFDAAFESSRSTLLVRERRGA